MAGQEAERFQRDATEKERRDSMDNDGAANCYVCTKNDKIFKRKLKRSSFFFSKLTDGSLGTAGTWKILIKFGQSQKLLAEPVAASKDSKL